MSEAPDDWVSEYSLSFRTQLLLPIALSFFGIVPVWSVSDILSVAPVVFAWPGSPVLWLVAAFFWLGFIWFAFITVRMFRYYLDPLVFKMSEGAIELSGRRISNGHVKRIRGRALFGDVLVETKYGSFSIHPQLTKGGVQALRSTYRRRFDAPGIEEIPWLVGK